MPPARRLDPVPLIPLMENGGSSTASVFGSQISSQINVNTFVFLHTISVIMKRKRYFVQLLDFRNVRAKNAPAPEPKWRPPGR